MKKFCLLIMCILLPLSVYADDMTKSENIELYIATALKPIISKTLSNHDRPIGCAFVLGGDYCKKNEFYGYSRYSEYEEIRTPKDVYCVAKKDCCKDFERQRNREQYCECYADQLRKKSYDLQTINKQTYFGLKLEMDDSCSQYSDTFMEAEQVYDRLFYECKNKNSDVKFCDKLAQTIQNLIKTELVNQASNRAKKNNSDMTQVAIIANATSFQLYESEYNKITTSTEFLSLFEQ